LVLLQYLHPFQYIISHFVNATNDPCIEGLNADRLEEKTVSGKKQLYVIFCHENFKNNDGTYVELHAIQRWATKILEEGPSDYFFSKAQETVVQEEQQPVVQDELPAPLVKAGVHGQADSWTLRQLQNTAGITIDDDEQPVPENILTPNNPAGNITMEEWGHSGICNWQQAGDTKSRASTTFTSSLTPSLSQLFELFFPMKFVQDVMLVKMNETVAEKILYGKFL